MPASYRPTDAVDIPKVGTKRGRRNAQAAQAWVLVCSSSAQRNGCAAYRESQEEEGASKGKFGVLEEDSKCNERLTSS
jgi:invasion protein IalB